ncbi:MAG: hypothetical protein WCJ72_20510 [Chryseobacterium sp.]
MSKNRSDDDSFIPILLIVNVILTVVFLVLLVFGWNRTGSSAIALGGIDPKVFDTHLAKFEKSINIHFDKTLGIVNDKNILSFNKVSASINSESNKISDIVKQESSRVYNSIVDVDKKLLLTENKIIENLNKLSENLISENHKLMDDFAKKYENLLSDTKTKYDKVDSQLSSLIQNSKDNLVSLKTQNNESKDFLSSAVSLKSKVNLDAVTLFKKESDDKQNYIAGQVIRVLNLFNLSSDDKLPGTLLVLDSGESMSDLVFDDIFNDIRSVLSSSIKLTPKRKFGFSSIRGEKVVQSLAFGIQDSLSVGNINKNDLAPDRNEVNNWKNSISNSINRLSAIDGPKRLIYLTSNPNNLKPIDVDFIFETQKSCVKHKIEIWVFHFLRNKDDSVSNDLSLIALGNGGQYFPIRLSKEFNKDPELVKVIKHNFLSFLYQAFGLNLVVESIRSN